MWASKVPCRLYLGLAFVPQIKHCVLDALVWNSFTRLVALSVASFLSEDDMMTGPKSPTIAVACEVLLVPLQQIHRAAPLEYHSRRAKTVQSTSTSGRVVAGCLSAGTTVLAKISHLDFARAQLVRWS